MINHYPYSDLHELNLDYILLKIKELKSKMDEFEALNKVTFVGAWSITDQYPANSVVIDNGIGYMALQPVPAGIPINNTDYWVVIDDYTFTQLAAMQHQLNEIQAQLLEKNVLVIGDSYVQQANWVANMMARIGLVLNQNYWCISLGGEGFTEGTGGNGYLAELQQLHSDVPDPDLITDILVVGGANDAKTANNYAIQTGMSDFMTYAKANFKNAKVYVGFIGACVPGGSGVGTITPDNLKFALYMYKTCERLGAYYLTGVEYCLHVNVSQMQGDGLHPTISAGNDIADAVMNAWLKGSASSVWIPYQLTVTASLTGDANKTIDYTIENGVVTLYKELATFDIQPGSAETFSGGNTPTKIGEINNLFFTKRVNIPVTAMVVNGGTNEVMPAYISIEGKDVGFAAAYGPGYWTSFQATRINILPFTATFSALDIV